MMFAVTTIALLCVVGSGFGSPQYRVPVQALSEGLGDDRIINGGQALLGLFPHQGALLYQGLFSCGCSLISEQFVVTAGHCVYLRKAYGFTVVLGITELRGSEESRQEKAVSTSYLHPEYAAVGPHNNIAVLKLTSPVVLSRFVQPIPLASNPDNVGPDTRLITSGWGLTSDESLAVNQELLYVKVSAIGTSECSTVYGNSSNEDVICALERQNTAGVCHGDSGGPLIADSTEKYTLVGITSFTHELGCESNNPGVFTRVQSHLNFIQSIISA